MNFIRCFLLLAALCVSGSAFAQTGAADGVDPQWAQYIQSCGLGEASGFTTSSTAGDSKTLQYASLPVWDGNAQLFRYGEQYVVRVGADGPVLLCQGHTVTATISTGTATGDGLGHTAVDTLTPAGKANCTFIPANASAEIKVSARRLKYSQTAASRMPLSRPGRCSTVGAATGPNPALGGGCATSAECGSGGVCDLTRAPLGVYFYVISTAASVEGQLLRCTQ